MIWLKKPLLGGTLRLESEILFSWSTKAMNFELIPNLNNRTIWKVEKLVAREWAQAVFMSVVSQPYLYLYKYLNCLVK